jgi:hypothetical protein
MASLGASLGAGHGRSPCRAGSGISAAGPARARLDLDQRRLNQRSINESSPRTRGPITTDVRCRTKLWSQLRVSRTSVVMGPGSRFASPGRWR